MQSTTNLKLARGLKVVIDFIYVLLVFVCAGLVLWMVVYELITRGDLVVTTDPVQVTLLPGEESPAGGALITGLEDQPEGTLAAGSLENGRRERVLIDTAIKFVYAIALVYLFTLLRDFLRGFIDKSLIAQEQAQPVRERG
jgi:hypothetical protein